jgi:hypothetical protein
LTAAGVVAIRVAGGEVGAGAPADRSEVGAVDRR